MHKTCDNMKNFIKLTNMLINKAHITRIVHDQSMYYIYTTNFDIDGIFLFAVGSWSTRYDRIDICKTKNEKDYEIITNFIKDL